MLFKFIYYYILTFSIYSLNKYWVGLRGVKDIMTPGEFGSRIRVEFNFNEVHLKY